MKGKFLKLKSIFKKTPSEQIISIPGQGVSYEWVLLQREFFFAVIITAVATCAGFSDVLFLSNDLYPSTADAMGHMTKVKYLAECFARGEIPTWFPYWYTGSTVAQYYPPLSYLLMVPIYMLTNSTMLTYKINCFIMIFVGGMGVWNFCRLYIGRWCGLIGTVFYCLQPYVLLSFFAAGVLAQGPIFALTPWFLIAILSCAQKPSAKIFLICTLMVFFLMLSHVMHAFMVCFCIMVVLFFFVPFKKISFRNYLFTAFSIILGVGLCSFWWVVGVTHLENPGVPALLGEAIMIYTATVQWFTNFGNIPTPFYFGIPITILCVVALLIFVISFLIKRFIKKRQEKVNFYLVYCLALTFFTFVFSFGTRLPFFHFIPFASNIVPGRILSLTSATGAVLCAYVFYSIYTSSKNKIWGWKILSLFLCFVILAGSLITINPYAIKRGYIDSDNPLSANHMFESVDTSGTNFEKGRYTWLTAIESSDTYFPLLYDLNTGDGWNIEGSAHNQTIWNFITAIASDNYDYISKNLALWNIRYLMINNKYDGLVPSLNKHYNFQLKFTRSNNLFYYDDSPSSYFLTDSRNALLIGPGSIAVAIEFPYFVKGLYNDITNYSMEELEKYDVIYLCEPNVPTESQKTATEDIISALVKKGKKIIIEPASGVDSKLFGVIAMDIPLENDPVLEKQDLCPFKTDIKQMNIDKRYNYARILNGLDQSYYTLCQNEKSMQDDAIGVKNIDGGSILFIGMHLSQQMKAVYTRNWGLPEDDDFPMGADETKVLFKDIFKYLHVDFNFWPGNFPVESSTWNYKGGTFNYNSSTDQDIIVSVTYAPRWKAYLDGQEMPVGEKENLIFLSLPAGEHKVVLEYGITKYGAIGYLMSIFAAICLIIFIIFFDKFKNLYNKGVRDFRQYMQLPPKS